MKKFIEALITKKIKLEETYSSINLLISEKKADDPSFTRPVIDEEQSIINQLNDIIELTDLFFEEYNALIHGTKKT